LVESCTDVFLGGHFLFTCSTLVVGCIISQTDVLITEFHLNLALCKFYDLLTYKLRAVRSAKKANMHTPNHKISTYSDCNTTYSETSCPPNKS